MSIRTDLKRSLPLILADSVVVNLGLFLGVLARYVVLVGLGEASILLSHFTTPADLWRQSMQAYRSAAPWLSLICLIVFGLSGFYRTEQPYRDRGRIRHCGISAEGRHSLPGDHQRRRHKFIRD